MLLRILLPSGGLWPRGVGSPDQYSGVYTIVETWNGKIWVVGTPPSPGRSYNVLDGVSCSSPAACTAVGYNSNPTAYQTLIETWNGTDWTQATSPDDGVDGNSLSAVSCSAWDFCLAVGDYSNGTTYQALAEEWDGISWQLVASPTAGTLGDRLRGVSCGPTECITTGDYWDGTAEQTLTENGVFTFAPTIVSAQQTTFFVGQKNSFNIVASGLPTPLLSETGALPAGVKFESGYRSALFKPQTHAERNL